MGMIVVLPWPADDAASLEQLYAEVDQQYCLVALPVPLPESKTAQYLNAIRIGETNGLPLLCLAVMHDEGIIGKIDLFRSPDQSAEIDIVLKQRFTHQGYGTEALRQAIAMIRQIHWCTSIHAYIRQDNLPAVKLMEASGFTANRRFKADIMKEENGLYQLSVVQGIEYVLQL